MIKDLQKAIIIIFTSLLNVYSYGQTPLKEGDIAIVGYNYDASPQEMTIAVLANVSTGTEIRIADYAFDETSDAFSSTSIDSPYEGSITWTTTSAIAAGTIIKLTITSGTTPAVTGLPGTVEVSGWKNTNPANSPVAAGGDNWFIFQVASKSDYTFIFGWANPFAATLNGIDQPAGKFLVHGSGTPTLQSSYLPSSLTLGSSAIALNRDPSLKGYHGDNNVYIGPKSGSKVELLAAICSPSYWSTSEKTIFDINAGGTNFPGTNPVFKLPNSAPTNIELSATSLTENVAANTTVGTLSSTDTDADEFFTYTLADGTDSTDNAFFNISGNSLRITDSPDFETKSIYNIRVRTTDLGGLTFEKNFMISITNLNEAPFNIGLYCSSCSGPGSGGRIWVSENVPANTFVGQLSSADVDAGNTFFIYSLVAGEGSTDNAYFNIIGNGLRITNSPDYETKSSYSIRIRTKDQGGLTFEEVFTIYIKNEFEAPSDITLSSTSVEENVASNTIVGTFKTIADPLDRDSNDYQYTLVNGTGSIDNGFFYISGNTLIVKYSPDFEILPSLSIRVRTKGPIYTVEKEFIIKVIDLDETVTSINDQAKFGKMNLMIYPNPAAEQLIISLEKEGIYTLKLIDQTGVQTLLTELSGKEMKLDISQLNQGAYTLIVNDNENKETINRKFIITK